MPRLTVIISLILITFGLFIHTAEAARFGGGRSFGIRHSFHSTSHYQQSTRPIPAPASSTTNRWVAPLAGLAIGSLLGYLLMGNGISSGLLAWFVIFSIGMILWNLFRTRTRAVTHNNNQFQSNMIGVQANKNNMEYSSSLGGIEPEIFLREAKTHFIRLQAAYDVKDLNDLCEFTTPEVFAEIQLQLQERGDVINKTEVVTLEAELMDNASYLSSPIISVKFTGKIKEDINAPVNPFSEIWHFRKNSLGGKWVVAGVQQI